MLGNAAGGAYGASRGPQAIRRVLDTERTSAFVAVLVGSVLVGALSDWVVLMAITRSYEPRDRDMDIAGVVVFASFGLVLVSAVRLACDVLLRWWWRGRRSGRLIDAVAPSGEAATTVRRSRAALVVPFLFSVLLTAYGVGLALSAARALGVWWAIPPLAIAVWGLCYLAPFLLGRVRAGGLFLTPQGVEHRFGTTTGVVRWTSLGEIRSVTPFALAGATVTRTFAWDIAGDPTDRVAEPGSVDIPRTYLELTPDRVVALLETYVEQPHLRQFLGTPAPREWTEGAYPIQP